MTTEEFQAILYADKCIAGDAIFRPDEDHSPGIEFRMDLESEVGHPMFVRGSANKLAGTISLGIIHRAFGRIYGLDLGKVHRNPNGAMIGDPHKHAWRDTTLCAKVAYEPKDITGRMPDVLLVWNQFCSEAKIKHQGRLILPPDFAQKGLFDDA